MTASKQDSIRQLVEQWDELRAANHEVGVEQLCKDAPEWEPELRNQIDRLKAMDWLDAPMDDCDCALDDQAMNRSPEMAIAASRVPATLDGRYQMESLLAEGGFAQVWRAIDKELQRPVAIKVTTVDCHAEAQRVAQLKHHGIIAVHDVGSADGLCYIVFDLVEGSTLEEKIRQKEFDWRQSAEVVAQIAEIVQFAHEKGFIHRDIKPANILFDEFGSPVLADFGIAVTECELRNESVTSIGTLAYMAPEQLVAGGKVDVRTDVYGLGVVFYEMLTGVKPFSKPTLTQLREAILEGNPSPPQTLKSEIPLEFDRICMKCLARRSDDRYASARDLAAALKQQFASSHN